MLNLDTKSSWSRHVLRTMLIVILSIVFVPLSAFIMLLANLLQQANFVHSPRRSLASVSKAVPNDDFKPPRPRILVTGVGMSKGLFLARTMYLGGCDVIGADFDNKHGNYYCGRFSNAVHKFFALKNPNVEGLEAYIAHFFNIIRMEKIDVWISCSGVATAVADAKLAHAIEKSTMCKVFQFDEDVIETLDDKLKFMEKTSELGLLDMRWHPLRSTNDVPDAIESLHTLDQQNVRFMVKSASMDDATRGSLPLLHSGDIDKATQILTNLDYSNGRQWILQEFIESGEEYCTHAVVIKGRVRAFTACSSASVLMHYRQLRPDAILYTKMLAFTQDYARGLGNITGHLSFDFLVRYEENENGYAASLVPIECNPRCHTATVLFEGKEIELADKYLEVLNEAKDNGILEMFKPAAKGFHWKAHDLVVLVSSYFDFFFARDRAGAVERVLGSLTLLLLWRDPTFLWWDPLPWFVLNHLYWPWELLVATWQGTRWKELNVSTTKMFKM